MTIKLDESDQLFPVIAIHSLNMEEFKEIAGSNLSDSDDRCLFRSLKYPDLPSIVLRIKHNDPEAKHILMVYEDDLEETAWTRLGQILGQASHVEKVAFHYCPLNVADLCGGLQYNYSIVDLNLNGTDLGDTKLSSLVPFLSHNLRLNALSLSRCNLGPAGVTLLSGALSNRTEDTLERLDLNGNRFGDMDLEKLVLVLARNKKMRSMV